MAEKRRPRPRARHGGAALERGAAAVDAGAGAAAAGRTLLSLPLEAIERNPEQPRKRFEEAKLEELAASIREHGIVEPILVRQGGRRSTGSSPASGAGARRSAPGLQEIPAVRARGERARGVRARARREPPARGPERDRGGGGVRGPRSQRPRPHPGGDRAAGREGALDRRERAPAPEAARGGARSRPGRPARHGPRPGAARPRGARRRSGRRPSGRSARGSRVRATEALVRQLLGTQGKKRPPQRARDPGVRRLATAPAAPAGGAVPGASPSPRSPGALEVEYTSLDELDGILAKIGA